MTTPLAIFLLIVLAAWPLTKLALWKRRLRALEEAKSTGDAKRASEILLSLYRLRPKNIEFLRELIDLHLESKDLPQAETELLLRAHRAFPEDDRYVKALAGEFSASGRRDREACRIFAHRVRISARPGPWAFTLAQTYCALGEYDLATRAYHQAVRHGLDDPQLPGALAELYVKLQITGPQALPTLKEVFSLNTGNVPFLKVFCESCRANRLFDEQSIEAARALLSSDPSAARGHELLSAHFLRQGKLQDSIRHGRAALESDPQSEVASLLLATCYARETRRDESAMQLYRQVVSADPKAQEILLTLSRAYIQAGRDDREAEDILRRTLDQAPSDAMILTHLAAIAARNEDYDLAVQTCEELQVLGDSSPGRLLQLAEAYCAGRVMNDKAERTCRRALLHQPGHERLIGHLARIYGAQGRTDPPAVAVYERAFERDPDPEVGRLLAESYVQSQRMEKALSMARRVLRINPKEQSLEKLIVDAGAELDRLNAAISEQESTLHREPNNEEAICRLAELNGAQRRYDADALESYRRAAILHPEDAGRHTAVVRACADRGDWDAVLGAVQQFLSHTPANINPAIALMEELSKTRPEALKLRWFLVETLIFGGKFRRAMGHLDNITDLDSGQGERALASYDRIIEKAPDETEAHRRRALILLSLGRESEARYDLEEAHRGAPEDSITARCLIDLYRAQLDKNDSPSLRFKLGELARRCGQWELAVSCFQPAGSEETQNGASVIALARCFVAEGLLDRALQCAGRIPVSDEVKNLLYDLGARYEALGDAGGAREAREAIAQVDPSFRDVSKKLAPCVTKGCDLKEVMRAAIIQGLPPEAKTRYDLVKELGRGATGVICKARDNELKEIIALKILREELAGHPEALRRFRAEAKNARRLSHVNIVKIIDVGEELGRNYIAMELIEGTDLKKRLAEVKTGLALDEMLNISGQVCEGLAAAHDAGVMHLDIKPANIMITKTNRVKITDFGLAQMMEQESREGTLGVDGVEGTPLYMSPEQFQGLSIDHRADIYSLGIVLHEMAMGRPPFVEGDIAHHHLHSRPRPLTGRAPERYAAIVARCLEKKPEDRWQSVREILDELGKIDASEGTVNKAG